MQLGLLLNVMSISYSLKRSTRAHTMRLAVYPDARVVVTAPTFFAAEVVERFIVTHARWIEKHVGRAQSRTVVRIQRRDIVKLKADALVLAHERSAHFAKRYGFAFRKISVRAQKSRWGSCSRTGNLSFNYKIAALPPRTADYIIVHELCHLAEMNHSKKFWDLVAREIPEHKALRKELRNIVTLFS